MYFREIVGSNIKNIIGKNLRTKYCVIECDDWGGIRMPTADVCKVLISGGIVNPESRYITDSLETTEDLVRLFGILNSVKDCHGKRAVMTPITNVANPDFDKIKKDKFTKYHYEKFTDSYIRYDRGFGVRELWQQGIESGIFIPELHGREHINVQLWMRELMNGNADVLFAFNNGYVADRAFSFGTHGESLRAEFELDSETQIPFLIKSIQDSVTIFKEVFGYQPSVFVPSNGVFHPIFEKSLFDAGVRYLNVQRTMRYTNSDGRRRYKIHFSGQRSATGLIYYTRNCAFEPSAKEYTGIEHTIMQIAAAFRWGKPALISTHRVNFVGGINSKSREFGLLELKKLLKEIVRRWPDVEFIGLGSLLNLYAINK